MLIFNLQSSFLLSLTVSNLPLDVFGVSSVMSLGFFVSIVHNANSSYEI